MQRIHELAINAAQRRRQEVADRVAGAHVVEIATKAATPSCWSEEAGSRDQVGTHAHRAERVIHGVAPEGRRVVAPKPQLAESPHQAQGGATGES
ncbi:hypothetical protein D3C87_1344260 [compost metagenome]